jgi:hypothetical protein
MAELIDSTNALASETVVDHERAFRNELIRALKSSGRRFAQGTAAPELAELLTVISVGLKHRTTSLPHYRERLHEAARLLCKAER